MERFNVFSGELKPGFDREGYGARWERLGPLIGAESIGASVYELEEGQQTFPYHFHHGVEEWLLVVEGTPTLRAPAGERALRRGDVVCFPSRAEGAHAVRGPGRIVLFSTGSRPSISVYPDSDKVGVRGEGDEEHLDFRRGDAVDYWEGE
ncbi:MAG: cupin domain-containing protein [Actinomycetota bacterium]|nr:cupin domain-containing protein [Actinomycetota bacterium]